MISAKQRCTYVVATAVCPPLQHHNPGSPSGQESQHFPPPAGGRRGGGGMAELISILHSTPSHKLSGEW